MAVTMSGYPTGFPRRITDPIQEFNIRKGYYYFPDNDSMYITFYTGRNDQTLSRIFSYMVFRIGDSIPITTWSITEKYPLEEFYFSNSTSDYDVRMKIIERLYDSFRERMFITNDSKMKMFFFDAAYKALFAEYDKVQFRAIQKPKPETKPEQKPEPLDHTPPEVKSALHLHEKGIGLKNKIYQDMREYQREVSEHYKKYGTLGQRFIEHIKSLFLK